jgi:hypothetical protein
VEMQVDLYKHARVNAQLACLGAHIALSQLGAFAHHLTQVLCQR